MLHVNYTNTILIASKPPPAIYFFDLTESKWDWRKTKTECNLVNNKLGAKYGANELFGLVNFTDCIKLAR